VTRSGPSTAGPSLSVAAPQSPAAAQAVISWEHDQIEPEVAYGSGPNQYLVVWEDHHWASGDARDILGRRINTSGAGVGGAFNISWEGNERFSPDVAYNSVRQNYLVVFEYEFSLTDHDIYGRIVNSDGTLGSEFAIATPSAYDLNPIVAYSSALDSYLVVWERRIGDPEFGQKDIYARVVNYDGSLPGSEIALDTGSASQEHPAIAYNSSGWDEYLVVWQDRQAGNWDIMGRRVDSDGDLLEGEFTIEAPGHDQTRPDIAYNSRHTEYLVVWQDQIGGATSDWDIKAWRRNIAGSAVGSYLISSAGTQRRMKPAVTYKYEADEYLVVYEYEYSATDLDLKQSRLRWDGVARQTDATVSNAYNIHEARPAVASDGAWSNLVVWEDARNAGTMAIDIYGDVVPVYAFQGSVFEGLPTDTSSPLAGVELGLWCNTSPDGWGDYLEGTITDSSGHYALVAHGSCSYYNIGEYTPEGYESTGAATVGGTVLSWEQIQYSGSLAGQTLTGNNFWDAPQPPAAPAGVAASDGTYADRVRITWAASAGTSYYEVHRATSSGGTKSYLGSVTGTTYDDTAATVGTTYYYWVRACNDYLCSSYSSYDTGYRAGEPPDPPIGVSATDGTYADRVQVSWSASSGATTYEVYRATSAAGGKTLLGSPSGSPYNDTSAEAGTTYYYWVKACNEWDCSGYSAYDTGYRTGEPPDPPTGVSATDGTYTDRVQVSWSASSGATYYQVWRATSSGGTKTLLSSPSASPYDDTGASVGTTYYYFVRACNDWGCGLYSSYDTGYRAGEPPDPPAGVSASDGTYTDRVEVTWNASSGATTYEVYRATSSGGAKTLLGSPGGSPYDDVTASAGVIYYYWVKACNEWGCSDYSAYDTGERSGPPLAPTNVAASDGTYTDRVEVSWSASSGATYYEVYRSESEGGAKTLLGSPAVSPFDDTIAAVGTTYYYWLVACNTWGCSGYSAHDTGYRSGTPPSAPGGVAATDGTYTDKVQVTWTGSSGATYYQVYRAASETGGKTLLGSPAGSPFDDTIALESTTYYYWLVACNTWGCSGYSAHDTGYRSLPPPGMVSWRSTRNRTSSDFAEFFADAEADGFMIVDIEVDEIDGVERVSGVFQKNLDGRGWDELRDMNSTEFQNKMADMRALDYRLVDQEVYTLSGSTYYAGIWIQNTESFEWESYVDVTDAEFSALFDTYSDLGYRIIDVDAYHIGGNLRYSGVWVENREGLDWLEFRDLTSEEFSQKYALYENAYRMIDVESYRVGENQYYACIWVENANGRRWAELRDMSSKVFHEKWMEWRDAGYRLTDQEVYPTADGWRYAGIWRQNSERPDWTLKGSVDTLLQTHFDQHNIPGMSVAIAKNGKFLYLRGFGYADVPNHVDANSRTIYRLASVSKAVAGALAMVLSDQNLIDLTRASSFYIPNLPAHHTHTVSQTLSNRSGIGHYNDNDTYKTISGHYATALDAAKALWDEPLVYAPGMGYKYSTHAYTFAGASMEGATGRPIADIVNDYLAAPYNLSTLRVEDRDDPNPNRSLLYSLVYSDTLEVTPEVTPDDLSWKVLGGGLESSAYDLARFGIQLLDGTILPPAALAAMWTPPDTSQCHEMGAVGVYALGWCIGTQSGTRAVFKSGVQNGAKSYILIYPDEGIVIAVLINSRFPETPHVPKELADAIGILMLARGSISASQHDQNRLVVTLTDPVEEPDDEGLDPADVVWPVSNPVVDPEPEDLEEPGDEPIVEIFLPLIMR
jgi:CubicO group peptidase (beta-lactamase class C family)/fibronectin type 3 domain-containing protein